VTEKRPPYLIRTVTRHDRVAWYVWRRPGPKIRIRGEYGSREFMNAYKAALFVEPKPKTKPGSLSELIADYKQSSAWRDELSDATRKTREQFFKMIEKAAGEKPVAEIDRAMIVATREKARSPAAARHILTTLRGLFKWAVEVERMDTNPTDGVAIPKPAKTQGYHTWTEAEIAAYKARWPLGTRQHLWLAILLHTGLRRGDATRLKWDDIQDGIISIVAQKTGTPVVIPLEPELADVMAMSQRGRVYVIESLDGEPFTPESFSVVFGKACKAAGVRGSAHGLRKAATVRLAHASGTVPELNAAMGWTGSRMAMKYSDAAERARLAKQAYEKARKKD
jgi:integrase